MWNMEKFQSDLKQELLLQIWFLNLKKEEFLMIALILWNKLLKEIFQLSKLKKLIEKEIFTTTEQPEISMMMQS